MVYCCGLTKLRYSNWCYLTNHAIPRHADYLQNFGKGGPRDLEGEMMKRTMIQKIVDKVFWLGVRWCLVTLSLALFYGALVEEEGWETVALLVNAAAIIVVSQEMVHVETL